MKFRFSASVAILFCSLSSGFLQTAVSAAGGSDFTYSRGNLLSIASGTSILAEYT